jgi:hypothetical protein
MVEALLIFLPLIMAFLATALAWRLISRRVLFFLTVCLSILGLQGIIAPAAIFYLLPSSGEVNEAMRRILISSSVIQVVIGIPFFLWLKNSFRNSNSSLDTTWIFPRNS